jgi:hypothetical protein
MSKEYYKEKLIKLVERLFTHEGDARCKLIENENLIEIVILASKSGDIEKETQNKWDVIWLELNSKPELNIGNRVSSSFARTIQSKRNKSLIKYLDFFLEEFYKVL